MIGLLNEAPQSEPAFLPSFGEGQRGGRSGGGHDSWLSSGLVRYVNIKVRNSPESQRLGSQGRLLPKAPVLTAYSLDSHIGIAC